MRLRPLPNPRFPPAPYALTVEPPPLSTHWQVDPLGNHVARLVLPGPLDRLMLEVAIDLDLTPRNAFDFLLEPESGAWPFLYAPETADALAPFRHPDHPGPLLQALCAETAAEAGTVPFLLSLAAQVRDRVAYIVRMEPGVWPPDRTLAEGRGSCRDSAWLLVQLLRMHGLAARFVSGYLVQHPEDGSPPGAEAARLGRSLPPRRRMDRRRRNLRLPDRRGPRPPRRNARPPGRRPAQRHRRARRSPPGNLRHRHPPFMTPAPLS